jgi:uncharacterized protein (DUF488 family)
VSTIGSITSVGYEGWASADDLASILAAGGVSLLVDVRLNAVSRKRGFSKNGLAATLAEHGIGYRNERSLGNPKDNREPFHRGEPAAWDRYRRLLGEPEAMAALDQLAAELDSGTRIALLCFERDPATCHRTAVVAALQERRPDVEVVEVGAPLR